MSRDPVPDWAGGRQNLDAEDGIARLRRIVADAEAVKLPGEVESSSGRITVRQARQVLAKLAPAAPAPTKEQEKPCDCGFPHLSESDLTIKEQP